MDDLRVIVRIIERVTKLTRPGSDLIRLKNLLLFLSSQVRKSFAVDILHRNAAGTLVVYEVVNPNDMRMRQFGAALRLTLELTNHSPTCTHQPRTHFHPNIPLHS